MKRKRIKQKKRKQIEQNKKRKSEETDEFEKVEVGVRRVG